MLKNVYKVKCNGKIIGNMLSLDYKNCNNCSINIINNKAIVIWDGATGVFNKYNYQHKNRFHEYHF